MDLLHLVELEQAVCIRKRARQHIASVLFNYCSCADRVAGVGDLSIFWQQVYFVTAKLHEIKCTIGFKMTKARLIGSEEICGVTEMFCCYFIIIITRFAPFKKTICSNKD